MHWNLFLEQLGILVHVYSMYMRSDGKVSEAMLREHSEVRPSSRFNWLCNAE